MKSRIIAIVGSQKKQSTPFVILLQVESVSSSSAMQRAVLLVCLEAASHQLSCNCNRLWQFKGKQGKHTKM